MSEFESDACFIECMDDMKVSNLCESGGCIAIDVVLVLPLCKFYGGSTETSNQRSGTWKGDACDR